jgi:hypothetical protein
MMHTIRFIRLVCFVDPIEHAHNAPLKIHTGRYFVSNVYNNVATSFFISYIYTYVI